MCVSDVFFPSVFRSRKLPGYLNLHLCAPKNVLLCHWQSVIVKKSRAQLGFEPRTSCTHSRNHTPRPLSRSRIRFYIELNKREGSGCGSERPKNIQILRIRMRNTAVYWSISAFNEHTGNHWWDIDRRIVCKESIFVSFRFKWFLEKENISLACIPLITKKYTPREYSSCIQHFTQQWNENNMNVSNNLLMLRSGSRNPAMKWKWHEYLKQFVDVEKRKP